MLNPFETDPFDYAILVAFVAIGLQAHAASLASQMTGDKFFLLESPDSPETSKNA